MTDIATLAAPSPIALVTPGAQPTPTAAGAAPGAEGAVDPFAVLLASLTTAPTTDAETAPAAPAVTTPVAPVAVALPTLPVTKAPPTTLVLVEEPIVAEQDGEETQDAPADDGSADTDQPEDPQLAMMLALAPPPPAPTPAPAPIVPAIMIPVTTADPAQAEPIIAAVSGPPAKAPAPPAATAAKPEKTDAPATPGTKPAGVDPEQDVDASARARFASLAARLFGSTAAPPAARRSQVASIASADGNAVDLPTPALEVVNAAAAAPDPATSQPAAPAAPRDPRIVIPAPSAAPELPAVAVRTKNQADAPDAGSALFATPASQPSQSTQATGATTAAAPTPDAAVTRELSVARDGQWLDTLARDIAATAGKDGSLSFRLDPHHLGSLTVHINQSAEGASVRLSADTESGRAMLQDAQPRLVAEARAQGLTLRETSVDMGGSGTNSSGQQAQTAANFAQDQSQQRNPAPDQTFINLDAREGDDAARGPEADAGSDLYA